MKGSTFVNSYDIFSALMWFEIILMRRKACEEESIFKGHAV